MKVASWGRWQGRAGRARSGSGWAVADPRVGSPQLFSWEAFCAQAVGSFSESAEERPEPSRVSFQELGLPSAHGPGGGAPLLGSPLLWHVPGLRRHCWVSPPVSWPLPGAQAAQLPQTVPEDRRLDGVWAPWAGRLSEPWSAHWSPAWPSPRRWAYHSAAHTCASLLVSPEGPEQTPPSSGSTPSPRRPLKWEVLPRATYALVS